MRGESLATGLRCIACGHEHALGYRLDCARCGGLLELTYELGALAAAGPRALSGQASGATHRCCRSRTPAIA